MASSSSQRQWSSTGPAHLELDKLDVQRSLQEAAEDIKVKLHSKDCFVKATVSDPPELMRQHALSSCDTPPSNWRDHQKPSVLQLWNAYWEKDAYSKREDQIFFYRSYTGLTRTLKLDPFATIAEVEVAIEKKEGQALLEGSLTSHGKALSKKRLDLNDYNVKPGSTFELPSCLCGGGNDDDVRTDQGPSAAQNSAQPDNALLSASTGEASLLPEGDPPESLRAQQNISAPHGGQDSTGVAQEPEPEPDLEGEINVTSGNETTPADRTPSKPNASISTRKISPVERAVTLKWLQRFATKCSGMRFSFTRKEYVDAADGGGNQNGIDITAENLGAHRAARRAAERAGTGKPVIVRYVDIPFEDMTTADVMEAIIRPVCRKHHKSYAEAAIMPDAVGFVGDPTYFVSIFPNFNVHTGVCSLTLFSLALHFRLHTHGTICT